MDKVCRIGTDLSSIGLAPSPAQQRIPGKFILLNRPDTFRIRFVSSTFIALAASCGAVGSVLALGDAGISFDTLKTIATYYGILLAGFAVGVRSYAGRVTADSVSGFITLRGHSFMGSLRKRAEVFPLHQMSLAADFKFFTILKFPSRFWLLPKRSAFSAKKSMFFQNEKIPLSADLALKPPENRISGRIAISSELERFSLAKDGLPATAADDARLLAFLKNPLR